MTQGNLEGRYIGCRTDEPLCKEGIRLLKGSVYPSADRIYASPMRRCVETAQILWEKISVVPVPVLQECDFGDFENKNYQELSDDPVYQAWIDSGGTLPFPGGESMEAFKRRCQSGFAELVLQIRELEMQFFADRKSKTRTETPGMGFSEGRSQNLPLRVALVVHGGTIMAIMERFGFPKKDYFDYQVKNGCGYVLTPVEGTDLWNYQCLP